MASALGFVPVLHSPGNGRSATINRPPVLVPADLPVLALLVDSQGELTVLPAGEATDLPGTLLAEVAARTSGGTPAWWLAPRSASLLVNGLAPLALTLLAPGDLLAFAAHWWLTVSQWTPQPGPAPAEMAEKPCPVCGMPLNLAPVAQCPCGRYYHLEKPEGNEEADALNCFLAGPCRMCSRTPTLAPVLMPEPSAKLAGTVAGNDE
jgi:hypothetical protein